MALLLHLHHDCKSNGQSRTLSNELEVFDASVQYRSRGIMETPLQQTSVSLSISTNGDFQCHPSIVLIDGSPEYSQNFLKFLTVSVYDGSGTVRASQV